MASTESDLCEDTEVNPKKDDKKIDKIVDREREVEVAKRQARREKQNENRKSHGLLRRTVSRVKQSFTKPVSGQVTDIQPVDEDSLRIVVDIDGTETSEVLAVPQSSDEYESSPKLMRLLDYVGARRTDISGLRGEHVPVRQKTKESYEIVTPRQFNIVARGIFSVWQSLFRYKIIRKRRTTYKEYHELTNRGVGVTSPFGAVVGFGGSELLFTLAQQAGTIESVTMTLAGLILVGFGIASVLLFGYSVVNWTVRKSVDIVKKITGKLKKLSPF